MLISVAVGNSSNIALYLWQSVDSTVIDRLCAIEHTIEVSSLKPRRQDFL